MSYYPQIPGAKREGPSQEAADLVAPQVLSLREVTLRAFHASAKGLTADAAAEVLALSILSIRPRVAELSRLGKIEDTGQRRRNQSGKKATVWRVKWKKNLFE